MIKNNLIKNAPEIFLKGLWILAAMPAGRHKSRTMRRVFKKTPGARNVLRYELKKPKAPRCRCGALLHGIPRLRANKRRKLGVSKKSNERPFGGNLCSKCMRIEMKKKARSA